VNVRLRRQGFEGSGEPPTTGVSRLCALDLCFESSSFELIVLFNSHA
jgi:hypothetical protein